MENDPSGTPSGSQGANLGKLGLQTAKFRVLGGKIGKFRRKTVKICEWSCVVLRLRPERRVTTPFGG